MKKNLNQPSAIGKPTIIGYNTPENFEQIKTRHKKEIDDLQSNCKHKERSDWMPFMWAPGHMGNPVRVCKLCGKIVETQRTMISKRDLLTPLTEWERTHNITKTRDDMNRPQPEAGKTMTEGRF